MNYDATKDLGFLINAIATHMLSNDDVYQAASTLPREYFQYFSISNDALIEFYFAVRYEPELAVHLVDKYIMTEATNKFFPWGPTFDKKAKLDFIDKELGYEYTLLSGITIDTRAIDILIHPERYDEESLSFAREHIESRIKDSGKDHPNMEKLFSFKNDEKEAGVSSSEQHTNEEVRFEIKDNNQCLAVLDYLKDTGVIDGNTSLDLFVASIVKADMSGIRPLLIDKYRMAVARMVSMIKSRPYKWQKLACKSLGVTASYALGNVTKNAEWDEELCKILPKLRRK